MFEHAFDMSIPPGHFVETEHEARQWMQHYLRTSKPDMNNGLGLDSETTGLVRHKDRVIIWSLSDGQSRICLESKFIPLFREPILENPEIPFDLTNAGFDAHMFANTGADISKAGEWRCTIAQSWLLNENNQGRHGLKDQIRAQFGREPPSFEATFGKVPPKRKGHPIVTPGDLIRAAMADPQRKVAASNYASMDAYNSTVLRAHFDRMLDAEPMYPGMSLKQYFYAVEVPFLKVLWKMERRGVTVDAGYLRSLQGPMEEQMARIEHEFAKAAGRLINMNSTNDIRWFFYDFLGKVPEKFTKGGVNGNPQPSTDAEVLEGWAGQGCQWSNLLLEHRSISKTYGTYVTGLQEWLDPNFRIHTTFKQTLVTGRLSSSEPNLQNIPRASDDKFLIREAFIPGERRCLIVCDYEQLEMRLMAHFCQDEKMIRAIHDGTDLHCLTVSEMHGIPYDEVYGAKKAEKEAKKPGGTPLTQRQEHLLFLRQGAKATGFGIIYGIGGARLAAGLTRGGSQVVTPEEGFRLIDKWFGVFPGAKQYIDYTKNQLWQDGRVQTIMGRFRRFGDLRGMPKGDAKQAERQGVNSIIQGSAADIAKMAMIKAEYDPELISLDCQMLLQVHDELMFECPDDPEIIKACKKRVREIMENPFSSPLRVPLPVEGSHGYSWASAK